MIAGNGVAGREMASHAARLLPSRPIRQAAAAQAATYPAAARAANAHIAAVMLATGNILRPPAGQDQRLCRFGGRGGGSIMRGL